MKQTKHINEVIAGEVLAADLLQNGLLLMKRGSVLSQAAIAGLRERQVNQIAVQTDPETSVSTENASHYFFKTIEAIGYEHRYGKLMNEHEDVEFLLALFEGIYKSYPQQMKAMHRHSRYLFHHAFDVFVIGAIAAKRLGFEQLKELALGFFMHDLCKLSVPQSLLNKPSYLSRQEKNTWQNHVNLGMQHYNVAGLGEAADLAKEHHLLADSMVTLPDMAAQRLALLKITNSYSALTLVGPRKRIFSSQEAVQLLFEKGLDRELLIQFSELLGIYPPGAIVRLSDGSMAVVEQAAFSAPVLPFVTSIDAANCQEGKEAITNQHRTAAFQLPLDFSLTISRMLSYEPENHHNRMLEFIHFLSQHDYEKANRAFLFLSGSLCLEDIYKTLFIPSYFILARQKDKKQISIAAFSGGCSIIRKLIDEHHPQPEEADSPPSTRLLFFAGKQLRNHLQLHFFLQLLRLDGLNPVVMNKELVDMHTLVAASQEGIDQIYLIDLHMPGEHTAANASEVAMDGSLEMQIAAISCLHTSHLPLAEIESWLQNLPEKGSLFPEFSCTAAHV